jgi:hypothetical protein
MAKEKHTTHVRKLSKKTKKVVRRSPLKAAPSYARRGWKVFPVHSVNDGRCSCGKKECTSPGKHPRTRNGHKDATTDEGTVRRWWAKWPDANIGVATGKESGLIVLDVDPRNGGDESLAKLIEQHGALPETVSVSTGGGGKHYYFAYPNGTVKGGSNVLGKGLDLKADGGYVVAPPSGHASGGKYAWEAGPGSVKLAPMPRWMRPKITKKVASKKSQDNDPVAAITEGQRNDALASIAGGLRRKGLAEPEIRKALLSANETCCQPPLEDAEVIGIAESISKHEPGDSDRISSRVIGLLGPDAELFHAINGDAFIRFPVGEHFENWPLQSDTFREWLRAEYYKKYKKGINDVPLNEAIQTFTAIAKYEGDEYPVATRLAKLDDTVFLDLGDREWQAVKITRQGWQLVTDPPVRFHRAPGMLPLPVPTRNGDVGPLRDLMNIPDDGAWALVLAWLVAVLNPDIAHPILVVNGEQGSAKSSLCRIVQQVLDPHEAKLRTLPSCEENLGIACKNSRILPFDNVSHVSNDMSDALCKVSTGATHATRRRYTDDGEHLLRLKGAILLNGIGEIVFRGDMLSRAIMLHLQPIPMNARRSEQELAERFEEAHASILGGLLDAAVIAIGQYDAKARELKNLPRMADFFIWASAAESGLKLAPGAVRTAYMVNERDKRAMVLDNSPIAAPLLRFMRKKRSWEGTSGDLLAKLGAYRVRDGRSDWPRTPRGLRSQLDRLAPNLREEGIRITFPKGKSGPDSRRLLRIETTDPDQPTGPTGSPVKLTKKSLKKNAKRLTKKVKKRAVQAVRAVDPELTLGQDNESDPTVL